MERASGRLLSRALVGAPRFAADVRTPRGGRAGGEGGRGASAHGSGTAWAWAGEATLGQTRGVARRGSASAAGRIRERARREAAAY